MPSLLRVHTSDTGTRVSAHMYGRIVSRGGGHGRNR